MEEKKNELKEIEQAKKEMTQQIHQEEIKELLQNDTEVKEEVSEEIKISDKKQNILVRLIATMIDQTLAIGVAVGLLFLFDAILRLFGYYVAQRQPIFLIIFVIVNVIYSPIMESTKVKTTLGRKLLKL